MPCLNHPDAVADLSTCSRCGQEFCGDCVISLQGKTVCANCKKERVQDIKSGSTEEDLDMAGRGARFVGAFVDGLVVGVPLVVLIIVIIGADAFRGGAAAAAAKTNETGTTILLTLLPLLLSVTYEALMLTARGQTLGKMAAKTKVVRTDGSPISAGQAWGRAVSRNLMNVTRILGLIDVLMVFSKPRTTLHDRIAKTRVVAWKR